MLQAGTRDPEHLRLTREAGLRSYICVPMLARDRIIGALTLLTTQESGRRYDEEDLTMAELLGRRAGPETTGHAKMQQQHVFWMEMHEEVFGASLNALDGTADGVFLQGRCIDDMPQPWLPHTYASDLVAD